MAFIENDLPASSIPVTQTCSDQPFAPTHKHTFNGKAVDDEPKRPDIARPPPHCYVFMTGRPVERALAVRRVRQA